MEAEWRQTEAVRLDGGGGDTQMTPAMGRIQWPESLCLLLTCIPVAAKKKAMWLILATLFFFFFFFWFFRASKSNNKSKGRRPLGVFRGHMRFWTEVSTACKRRIWAAGGLEIVQNGAGAAASTLASFSARFSDSVGRFQDKLLFPRAARP